MPRSTDAERLLAEAQEALAVGAHARAVDAGWRAAAAAAQIGDEAVLEQLVDLAAKLAAGETKDTEQLRVYAEASLQDAKAGTRPPSMFERLLGRGRRAG
jgi:hypothetical protein